MRSLLVLCFIMLVGCGKLEVTDHGIYQKPENYKPSGTIDAEMADLLKEYSDEAAKRETPLTFSKIVEVNWVDTLKDGDQELWGLAQTYFNPDNSVVSAITLNKRLNTDVPACARKLVIFHEFSHALLGVKHTDRDPANVLHIMYWSSGYEQSANCDEETGTVYGGWSDYLDFLFKHQELEQID